MAHSTTHHGGSTSILAGLRRVFDDWRRDIARHRAFQRVHAELSQLSDRELADIGLGRADIVDVAWDASHRV